MLIVSELSEALEADRKGKFCKTEICNIVGLNESDDILFKEVFEDLVKDTFQDELADATIRIFDLAYKMGIDLESYIIVKMRYNSLREFKHGKKY